MAEQWMTQPHCPQPPFGFYPLKETVCPPRPALKQAEERLHAQRQHPHLPPNPSPDLATIDALKLEGLQPSDRQIVAALFRLQRRRTGAGSRGVSLVSGVWNSKNAPKKAQEKWRDQLQATEWA